VEFCPTSRFQLFNASSCHFVRLLVFSVQGWVSPFTWSTMEPERHLDHPLPLNFLLLFLRYIAVCSPKCEDFFRVAPPLSPLTGFTSQNPLRFTPSPPLVRGDSCCVFKVRVVSLPRPPFSYHATSPPFTSGKGRPLDIPSPVPCPAHSVTLQYYRDCVLSIMALSRLRTLWTTPCRWLEVRQVLPVFPTDDDRPPPVPYL